MKNVAFVHLGVSTFILSDSDFYQMHFASEEGNLTSTFDGTILSFYFSICSLF
jgi:hypothetical protein